VGPRVGMETVVKIDRPACNLVTIIPELPRFLMSNVSGTKLLVSCCFHTCIFGIRDSSVNIETGLRVGRSGYNSQRGSDGNFSLLHRVQTGSGDYLDSCSMVSGIFSRE